jgi:predicted RNA binding protein YcfA (HicA-like mRNA interferase family)
MTRIDKLYERLLANPAQRLDYRDFVSLIEAFGFRLGRTKGSHRSYVHPACKRPLVIQPKGKEAKPYQVREFLGMISDAGLERDT